MEFAGRALIRTSRSRRMSHFRLARPRSHQFCHHVIFACTTCGSIPLLHRCFRSTASRFYSIVPITSLGQQARNRHGISARRASTMPIQSWHSCSPLSSQVGRTGYRHCQTKGTCACVAVSTAIAYDYVTHNRPSNGRDVAGQIRIFHYGPPNRAMSKEGSLLRNPAR